MLVDVVTLEKINQEKYNAFEFIVFIRHKFGLSFVLGVMELLRRGEVDCAV